jgi:hypothetical protein
MSSTHYILAKHVPDVFRKEPKNIGVIVWSELGVAAQFWGMDAYGVIDRRQIPAFVNSASAYEQWVKFWLNEIQQPKVEFIGHGKFAAAQSPEFLTAIQTGNSDNFFLQESGVVLESLTKEELPALAKELFESLVTSEAIDEGDTTTIVKSECEKIIKSTRLNGNIHFEKARKVFPTVMVGDVQKVLQIEFSYAYVNGSIRWLGQPVALKRYPSQLAKEVESVCYRFERVLANDMITRDRATTFIYPMEDQIGDAAVKKAIDTLSIYTNVVDLRESEKAKSEFEKVASIPLEHS